jgi:hypothetical protein
MRAHNNPLYTDKSNIKAFTIYYCITNLKFPLANRTWKVGLEQVCVRATLSSPSIGSQIYLVVAGFWILVLFLKVKTLRYFKPIFELVCFWRVCPSPYLNGFKSATLFPDLHLGESSKLPHIARFEGYVNDSA